MASETQEQFDDTGKVVFDEYYNRPDPRWYFTELQEFGYRIAGEAQPVFRQTLKALRDTRNIEDVQAVDLGSSYGINAALLKHDVTLSDLNAHYTDPDIVNLDPEAMLAQDVEFYRRRRSDQHLEVVGIDTAGNAIRYGVGANLLDRGIVKDLEEEPLSVQEKEILDGTDLVISTGCIGYVTETSIEKILNATRDDRPWMAHSVLRMFLFEPYEAMLSEHGYVTEQLEGTLLQRQFATEEEMANVLANLEELGIDPQGMESEGWYHANVYISRPVEDAKKPLTIAI